MILYHNRTASELYQSCQNMYWLHNHYQGRGIIPKGINRDLWFGMCLHQAMQFVGELVMMIERRKDIVSFDSLARDVDIMLKSWMKDRLDSGEEQYSYNNEWTKTNDCYLIRGMVFSFIRYILPEWLNLYKIIMVENEIAIDLNSNARDLLSGNGLIIDIDTRKNTGYGGHELIWESRPDLLIIDRNRSGDITPRCFVVSLKTTKHKPASEGGDYRLEESHVYGEQEISEFTATTMLVNHRNNVLDQSFKYTKHDNRVPEETIGKLEKLSRNLKLPLPDGIKMIYFYKGYQKKEVGNEFDATIESPRIVFYNPIVRGFRRTNKDNSGATGAEYAHSYEFTNNANASGKGRLGKDWYPFAVWEDPVFGEDQDERIFNWIKKIELGEIQGGEANPIPKLFWTQPDIYFSQNDQVRWLEEKCDEANEIIGSLRFSNASDINPIQFRPNRQNCMFYKGSPCAYRKVCREGSYPQLETEWQFRLSHHKLERENQLVQISLKGDLGG